MSNETYIDFTSEEVLVLCELLALEPPPGLGADSLSDLALGDNEEILRAAAMKSMSARGVVTDGVVVDAVQEVMRTACNPGVMASASIEVDNIVETRFLAAMPEISVEHQGLSISLHRFIPFATRDLLTRVLRFVDLRPYEPEQDISFTMLDETLDQVSEALDSHDHEAAHEILMAEGVDEAAARSFVIALTMRHSSASITILHRPEDEQVVGGSLTWIDAGVSGLWVTELQVDDDDGETEVVDDADQVKLEVGLTSAKDVATELLSYLPEAFREYGVIF